MGFLMNSVADIKGKPALSTSTGIIWIWLSPGSQGKKHPRLIHLPDCRNGNWEKRGKISTGS